MFYHLEICIAVDSCDFMFKRDDDMIMTSEDNDGYFKMNVIMLLMAERNNESP